MGRIIERYARERGHEITSIIDPNCPDCHTTISDDTLGESEICIDFSHPDSVMENMRHVLELGRNMVVGTTGWFDHMESVRANVHQSGQGLIWSGNFSIGVNILFRILQHSTHLFDGMPEYDVLAHEFHHRNKADSPSGTARMISDILLDGISRKTRAVHDTLDRPIEAHEMHFTSSRGGSLPGTHLVMFDSEEDTIELRHTARGRDGFAYGAVLAAEFIQGKSGMYDVDDLMEAFISVEQT